MNGTMAAPSGARASSVRRKVLGSMVVLGLVGLIVGAGTWSAFTATTANPNNTFAAGTVTIGDNDANGAMFSLAGLIPGNSDSGCIQVTYTGSLSVPAPA